MNIYITASQLNFQRKQNKNDQLNPFDMSNTTLRALERQIGDDRF